MSRRRVAMSARSRRLVRLRTTAVPTALETTKPTRGGCPARASVWLAWTTISVDDFAVKNQVAPNIMMLAAVVFMPFATAYMGMNMGQRVPTVLYDIVLLATGLLNIRLVRLATSPPVVPHTAAR